MMDKNEIIERLERLARCAVHTVGELPFVMSLDDGIAIHEAIDMLRSQPEPHWVLCSERLPEHGGRYLISVLDGIVRRTTVAPYLPRCKAWMMTGRRAYWIVIAWMPLPEPYKGDSHETD